MKKFKRSGLCLQRISIMVGAWGPGPSTPQLGIGTHCSDLRLSILEVRRSMGSVLSPHYANEGTEAQREEASHGKSEADPRQ